MLRYAYAARHGLPSVCVGCSRGRGLMLPGCLKPVSAQECSALDEAACVKAVASDVQFLREVVRDMLPKAEACALGCMSLGLRLGAETGSVVRIFEAEGMTIFKNELEFAGCVQPCVSVNKRLRAWVE